MRFGIAHRTTLVAAFILCGLRCVAADVWLNRQITWEYGKEGSPWKTTINNPHGHEQYDLVLQPLWALEGGVVAIEIVLARSAQPDANLLGDRKNGAAYPFVITVEELDKGLAYSKFGAVRKLETDRLVLDIRIEGFRLGHGLGSGSTYCPSCKNLQRLSMWIRISGKPPA